MPICIKPKKREEITLSLDLFSFLEKKPLFYDEIDYERFPRIFSRLRPFFPSLKVVHIVGTNAKGTTGRFLATALHKEGLHVGHYTSPHIMRFEERIWIDGKEIETKVLQSAHAKLQNMLTSQESEALSYFEYTTLLAMLCFEGCDYVVLEAGLGGEHDATAVFEKLLTVVTPIDKDHEAFLGETIEAIATTKLNASAPLLLLAKQHHFQVYEIAREIAKKKGAKLYLSEAMLSEKVHAELFACAKKEHMPSYMIANMQTAAAAMLLLGKTPRKESFCDARLFGRMSRILPNVTVDVGHNPLAASSILKELEGKKVVLVYNSFKDKEYESILRILRPVLKRVEIISVDSQRIEEKEKLQKTLMELAIQYNDFNTIEQSEEYLVFGSFSVVEEFLKRIDA